MLSPQWGMNKSIWVRALTAEQNLEVLNPEKWRQEGESEKTYK